MTETSDAGASTRPDLRLRMPTPVEVAVACELLALVLSVAANLAAVWSDGMAAIVAAGATPFVLIGATYLFLSHRLPVAWTGEGWQSWWANLVAAVIVLVPVAVASYWHQRELLTEAHTPDWLATILPLPVDGLALRAALTLFALAHATHAASSTASTEETPGNADAAVVAGPVTPTTPDAAVTPPVVAPEAVNEALTLDTPLAVPAGELPEVAGCSPATVARARQLLATPRLDRGRLRPVGRPVLRAELGVTDHVAKALVRELRPLATVTTTAIASTTTDTEASA